MQYLFGLNPYSQGITRKIHLFYERLGGNEFIRVGNHLIVAGLQVVKFSVG